MMALIALPFLLGSGVATAHQLARAVPEVVAPTPPAPATAAVGVVEESRG
jgi:hypothetical protein